MKFLELRGNAYHVLLTCDEARIVVFCMKTLLTYKRDEGNSPFAWVHEVELTQCVAIVDRATVMCGNGSDSSTERQCSSTRGGWSLRSLCLVDTDGVAFEMDKGCLKLFVRSLCEVANRDIIMEYEFNLLSGFDRCEVRSLMHKLHLLLVSTRSDLVKLTT